MSRAGSTWAEAGLSQHPPRLSPSGVSEVDYSRYPARETQLQWLRFYLQAQKGMAVTSREVDRLYVQVNKFALVSAGGQAGAEGGRSRPRGPPHRPVAACGGASRAQGRLGGPGDPRPVLPGELLPGKTPRGQVLPLAPDQPLTLPASPFRAGSARALPGASSAGSARSGSRSRQATPLR